MSHSVQFALSLTIATFLAGSSRADWPSLNPFRKSDTPAVDPFSTRPGLTPQTPLTTASTATAPARGPVFVASNPNPRETTPTPSAPTSNPQSPTSNPQPPTSNPQSPTSPPTTNHQPPATPASLPRLPQAIARVGSETIFDIEIIGSVMSQLSQRARPDMPPQQIEALRVELMKDALDALIEQKLVVYKAKKEIPSEAFPRIEKSVFEQFDKVYVKELMNRAKVQTRADLERVLQQSGSSLERQKKAYLERTITAQWIRKEVNYEPEISHQEMLDYYQTHRDSYHVQGRSNWEELVVRFEKFRNQEEAHNAIAEMGNDILRGQPWADVAKQRSHGITASQGGARGWTNQGSLAAAVIDKAIFSLPVGKMSRIIQDERGLYIVRVVERQDATTKPFFDVQSDVREQIKKEKVTKDTKEYLAKLRAKTPIWTIFDPPQSAPRSEATSENPREVSQRAVRTP